MRSLVVLLPPLPATPHTEFGYAQEGGAQARVPAALLPLPTGAGAEVVAVVPAALLSWHQVELPRGVGARSPRLRAVLEGLLEDRLLDDPATLHFALQPQAREGAPAWVAACDRAWLRAAVHALEAAQRPAARIVPEFTPEGEPALFALGEGQDARLVSAGPQGVDLLPLAASALPLLPVPAVDCICVAEPAAAQAAEQLLQQKVQLQQAGERWLQASRSAWDLAQGEFASSGRARTAKKLAGGWADLLRAPQWKPLRWGAVLFAVLNLAGLNAWAWKERAALGDKREAVRQALTRTFPHVKLVVDAPVQMQKEVALLRQQAGGTGGNDLEAMLNALASAAPQQGVTAVEFNATGLRVKGQAADAGNAPQLKTLGYAAQRQGDTLVLTPENAQ